MRSVKSTAAMPPYPTSVSPSRLQGVRRRREAPDAPVYLARHSSAAPPAGATGRSAAARDLMHVYVFERGCVRAAAGSHQSWRQVVLFVTSFLVKGAPVWRSGWSVQSHHSQGLFTFRFSLGRRLSLVCGGPLSRSPLGPQMTHRRTRLSILPT